MQFAFEEDMTWREKETLWKREREMVTCGECGKEIIENHDSYCDMGGAPVCEECKTLGLCSTCAELWESEIDSEDMEAEEA